MIPLPAPFSGCGCSGSSTGSGVGYDPGHRRDARGDVRRRILTAAGSDRP
jgi:hypothetical protein